MIPLLDNAGERHPTGLSSFAATGRLDLLRPPAGYHPPLLRCKTWFEILTVSVPLRSTAQDSPGDLPGPCSMRDWHPDALAEALEKVRTDWERDLRHLLPQFVPYEVTRESVLARLG